MFLKIINSAWGDDSNWILITGQGLSKSLHTSLPAVTEVSATTLEARESHPHDVDFHAGRA